MTLSRGRDFFFALFTLSTGFSAITFIAHNLNLILKVFSKEKWVEVRDDSSEAGRVEWLPFTLKVSWSGWRVLGRWILSVRIYVGVFPRIIHYRAGFHPESKAIKTFGINLSTTSIELNLLVPPKFHLKWGHKNSKQIKLIFHAANRTRLSLQISSIIAVEVVNFYLGKPHCLIHQLKTFFKAFHARTSEKIFN